MLEPPNAYEPRTITDSTKVELLAKIPFEFKEAIEKDADKTITQAQNNLSQCGYFVSHHVEVAGVGSEFYLMPHPIGNGPTFNLIEGM